jgi:hypothetical protein
MNLFKKLLLAADNRKQYGHCIFKVSEAANHPIPSHSVNPFPKKGLTFSKKKKPAQKG